MTLDTKTPIIVTGVAGFIGRAVAERLLQAGEAVVGIDNFNAYYDPALKEARIDTLRDASSFRLVRADIAEPAVMLDLVRETGARQVVHLAAQAGVRYSIENPFAYERSNLLGHLEVLEACRQAPNLVHLVYASSSSVYGDRPLGGGFKESEAAETPTSLYAATKRSNELMSASYSHLYKIPQSGLRFFTVYGPWGRPDMAYYIFARKILAGEPIDVFGNGMMARDFTYIDDIVDGIVGVLAKPPTDGGHRVVNIGAGRPEGLLDMISILERALGVDAIRHMKPMQPGDVTATHADVSRLAEITGYAPNVRLEEGLQRFVDWYRASTKVLTSEV